MSNALVALVPFQASGGMCETVPAIMALDFKEIVAELAERPKSPSFRIILKLQNDYQNLHTDHKI